MSYVSCTKPSSMLLQYRMQEVQLVLAMIGPAMVLVMSAFIHLMVKELRMVTGKLLIAYKFVVVY